MFWYENPGAGKPAQLQPWPRHSIWKSTEFDAKPQTASGDYDGDGLANIATQTQNFIHFFHGTSRAPVARQHLRAMKPDWIQWLARPVKFADLNGDARLDLMRPGTNTLLIEVPNHYANDAKAREQTTNESGPGGVQKPRPSGLLGPVEVRPYAWINLEGR